MRSSWKSLYLIKCNKNNLKKIFNKRQPVTEFFFKKEISVYNGIYFNIKFFSISDSFNYKLGEFFKTRKTYKFRNKKLKKKNKNLKKKFKNLKKKIIKKKMILRRSTTNKQKKVSVTFLKKKINLNITNGI